jgi:HlyD family secretion protein
MKDIHAVITWLAVGLLSACGKPPSDHLDGYVETEPVRLAAPVAGRLVELKADFGHTLNPGDIAYRLDTDNEQLSVAEARARIRQAEAQARDLQSGKRPVELAVYEANVRAAEASLHAIEVDLKRQQEMNAQGYVSNSTLDVLKARRNAEAAQLEQMKAQLASARLAAREQAQAAAQAGVDVAKEQQAQRNWLLGQKTVLSPIAGRVEQVYFRPGEWVPAGSPVLSLLGPQAVKVRFYIPEPLLAKLPQGQKIKVRCDGCGHPLDAMLTYVAREAEFTPPVIYNKDNRVRLVFMAEAKPLPEQAVHLRPGQPVEVVLP